MRCLLTVLLLLLAAQTLVAIEPIPRRLPPLGIQLKPEDEARLAKRSTALREQLTNLAKKQDQASPDPDIEVFLKAVDWAVRFREFTDEKQLAQADWAFAQAEERLAALAQGKRPWLGATGRVVRGYRSAIDDSVQPYVVEIPAKLDTTKPIPLFVFLHGRGEKQTDLPFIYERGTRASQIQPENAIVVHPFGRQCIGHKSAGEIDVLDVASRTVKDYELDPRRVVLMGFSMGGAGAWHIGAHYTDRFCAIAPGAGFSETARFFKLDPEKVVWYEKALWGVYDVPLYVRNLFNVPVIAYSGENDGQIQAARVMEEAYAGEGKKLTHLVGPKTAHSYHPETLKELLGRLNEIALTDPKTPTEVHLQTRTLSYNKLHWVEVTGLAEHWHNTRVDAKLGDQNCTVTTANVTELFLRFPKRKEGDDHMSLLIDGQRMTSNRRESFGVTGVKKVEGKWTFGQPLLPKALAKRPGLQGPIDDAFRSPFLFVKPSGKSKHPKIQEWVDFELAHAIERWRTVFRGEPRVKLDTELTSAEIEACHLVVWGDPDSNKLLTGYQERLPIRWQGDQVVAGDRSFDAATHIPVLICPQPGNESRYIVLNSGPTFREVDDDNNSQQNPKLPDWAILDITTPPDNKAAGKVVAADFFDEQWRLKPAQGK